MIIYNKNKQKKSSQYSSKTSVRPTRPNLTKENKAFLKLLKLKVKQNV